MREGRTSPATAAGYGDSRWGGGMGAAPALNIAEATGNQAGNARLRYETARGSLYEARTALRVAVAWGYVADESARAALQSLDALGGRVFGLARR